MNNYDYGQPLLDEKFFKNGKDCRNKMSMHEAQKALDVMVEANKLTSDQYDSFWLGWYWNDSENSCVNG